MSDDSLPIIETITELAAELEDDTASQQEIATTVFDEYAGIAPEE